MCVCILEGLTQGKAQGESTSDIRRVEVKNRSHVRAKNVVYGVNQNFLDELHIKS